MLPRHGTPPGDIPYIHPIILLFSSSLSLPLSLPLPVSLPSYNFSFIFLSLSISLSDSPPSCHSPFLFLYLCLSLHRPVILPFFSSLSLSPVFFISPPLHISLYIFSLLSFSLSLHIYPHLSLYISILLSHSFPVLVPFSFYHSLSLPHPSFLIFLYTSLSLYISFPLITLLPLRSFSLFSAYLSLSFSVLAFFFFSFSIILPFSFSLTQSLHHFLLLSTSLFLPHLNFLYFCLSVYLPNFLSY